VGNQYNNKNLSRIGQRFGRLTIISFQGYGSNKKILAECKCDCGNVIVRKLNNIIYGSTQSCGCFRRESISNRYDNLQTIKNQLFNSYQNSAKSRNLEFTLTKEEFEKITLEDCHYCGLDVSFSTNTKIHNYSDLKLQYHGIDRVNNNEGYIESNVVACCKTCNYMKSSHSYEDFINRIKLIYTNINKNKYDR
jgi:hypothetical protein